MNLKNSVAFLCLILFFSDSIALEPLDDPIPEKIKPGSIVVSVKKFVRLPKTLDSSNNLTNRAHARIQYMVPFGYTAGTMMINDTRGVLYLTDHAGSAPRVYLDLTEQNVGFFDAAFPNEMGVAGIAFHPEFTSIGRPGFGKFYTAFSARSDSGVSDYLEEDAGSHESVVREWTARNPRAFPFKGESREVFRVGQFAPNHNVGSIGFNPVAEVGSSDYGMLYVSLGDGGAANDPQEYGQSLSEPMSSIVRIDPLGGGGSESYGVPDDNPFAGENWKLGIAPETWAYGLRHAQHFSWDTSGRMFICDIGQDQVEEINIGVAGANYGWRLREGTFATAFSVEGGEPGKVYDLLAPGNFVDPIAQYDHDEGNAIGGGFVYEGNAVPELQNKFVFSDLVRGRVFYIDVDNLMPGAVQKIKELRLSFDGVERVLSEVTSMENSYGPGQRVDLRLSVDALGEIYLLTKSDGWIRKVTSSGY